MVGAGAWATRWSRVTWDAGVQAGVRFPPGSVGSFVTHGVALNIAGLDVSDGHVFASMWCGAGSHGGVLRRGPVTH